MNDTSTHEEHTQRLGGSPGSGLPRPVVGILA